MRWVHLRELLFAYSTPWASPPVCFTASVLYTVSVITTITAKLKLQTTQESYAALLRTSLPYRDALNYTSRIAFQNGKMSNQVRLHQRVYREIRRRFSLPAQMACSVSRQVGAVYKGRWTRRAGGLAIKVDADDTSKACPHCGHVSDRNRPGKGLTFHCEQCGFTLHADLVGARNATLRTLLIRQDWIGRGLLSAAPDGSDDEAKAKRLERFLELRWSSDPRLVL
jgi:predicted transposase